MKADRAQGPATGTNEDPTEDMTEGLTEDARRAMRQTRAWVEAAVVGLNLCPFAKAPLAKGRVRYVHCAALDEAALLEALCAEIDALAGADPQRVETTLLVHPNVLGDFDAFNDFLDIADAAVEAMGQTGVLQIASFHPRYRFAGTAEDDLGNATNRSPHPTLQLLREASVERAVRKGPPAAAIVEANLRRLDALGARGWAALSAGWRDGDIDADGDGNQLR